jgi:hypothetical protein
MPIVFIVLLALGLPFAALLTIWFCDRLLMERIPKYDSEVTKTRTDIFSMRAAYAGFVVGLLILSIWALAVAALGLVAGLKLLRW